MNTQGKVANSSQDVPECDMPAEVSRVCVRTERASCWRVGGRESVLLAGACKRNMFSQARLQG